MRNKSRGAIFYCIDLHSTFFVKKSAGTRIVTERKVPVLTPSQQARLKVPLVFILKMKKKLVFVYFSFIL
jgi:hypothetical protein